MQVMNLIREFEMKKMRESDAVKDYAAQLLSIADKVRLLGKEFSNEKIVQKILVTLPEKYEATISSLENSKDLSTISLTELLHSLEAVEQRRLMRQGDTAEGAFQARMQKNAGHKNGKMNNNKPCSNNKKMGFSTLSSLQETIILHKNVGGDQIIGNGEYIPVKARNGCYRKPNRLKLIYDVLFVPDIDQNLLSVGQLVEKEFKVYFEDRNCIIKDAEGKDVFNIKMKGKSFALNLLEDEHTAILQQDSTTMFWDRRVEHFHHDDVLYMKKNQIAEGLPDLEKIFLYVLLVNMGSKLNFPFQRKYPGEQPKNCNWCILMLLTGEGDLILKEANGTVSFDHPTDSLIPGQTLVSGQKMIASVSEKNWSEGFLSFYATSEDEPIWEFPTASFARDLDCLYPMTCGKYGICSNGQCSCPKPADGETSYFRQISYNEPHLGCSEITPLSREASHYHSLLELKETTSFPFAPELDVSTDIEVASVPV
ncbi:hypothetical protein CK203_095593 [Vitis vinifera]|uniref:Retrovirus-related Pol polyprotein from transposon TNT 1-94-like beta-barrel domain-containing protein n=1 Tax=Vitis vinifera TaxID=29760 RepID=A0A438DC14_VITVI|nr:hypothetical protein CK203_095593 [Vitis vinifera]